jgi:hypothetical protein
MNKVLIIGSIILSTTMLLSCRPKTEESHRETTDASGTEQKARHYLQPMLHIGDTTTNLIAQFGDPVGQYETGDHELSMSFFFLDNKHEALVAGVGGFTAFFVSNRLVHWDPIYESVNPKFENSSVKHAPVAFEADHPVIMLSVVSQNQTNGWIYVNDPMFPNLGYIKRSPDLSVYSGQYVVYDSTENSSHTIEFILSQEDGGKLHTLTSENVGNQMALLVDTQVIAAPYVQGSIADGRVMLELSDPSYSILLQALKKAHKD